VIQTFDFSEALRLMKRGYRVQRVDWVEQRQLLIDHVGARIVCRCCPGPWEPGRDDILAEDWHLVDAEGGR
jgi:hypothetical protein